MVVSKKEMEKRKAKAALTCRWRVAMSERRRTARKHCSPHSALKCGPIFGVRLHYVVLWFIRGEEKKWKKRRMRKWTNNQSGERGRKSRAGQDCPR